MTEKRMDADGLREVKRVSLTKVVVARGAGTDRDVVRLVTMLFDDEGTCVAEYDPAWPTPHFGDPRKAWLQPAPPRSSPSRIDCSGTAFIVSGEYYQAELREDGTLVFHPNGCSHPRPSVQDENLCVCRLGRRRQA